VHLSHKRNAIADQRHFVLAISDMNEKVGAGIIIEFEEAVARLVFEFHTNAKLPFVGFFGLQLAISSSSKVVGTFSPIPPKPRGVPWRAAGYR
jgi:hypothetical protein